MKLKRENYSPTAFTRADGTVCLPGEYVEVDEKVGALLMTRGYVVDESGGVVATSEDPKPVKAKGRLVKKKPSEDAGEE